MVKHIFFFFVKSISRNYLLRYIRKKRCRCLISAVVCQKKGSISCREAGQCCQNWGFVPIVVIFRVKWESFFFECGFYLKNPHSKKKWSLLLTYKKSIKMVKWIFFHYMPALIQWQRKKISNWQNKLAHFSKKKVT